MTPRRLVVLGTLASDPYAGMAWMHLQIVVGLLRLGHDVTYLEATSNWPYDPRQRTKVCSADHALSYLARVAESFGVGDRWAYRPTYLDHEWRGPQRERADDLLARADAVFNVAGATQLAADGLRVGRSVLLGTDPVYHELRHAAGDAVVQGLVDEHDDVVTYGENIGTGHSPVPPLPRLRARTRQPVLLDRWSPRGDGRVYTTVANWHQEGRDVEFGGETYFWSKDREFARVIDVPTRVDVPVELATNLAPPETMPRTATSVHEPVKTRGVVDEARARLLANRWRLVDAVPMTEAPEPYHDYIEGSRAEFTVARDLNVRLRSGWFSERSACYLAAGRPVVTQDTGFGTVLPTGEGLFAFTTADEAVVAIEAIEADYPRHSRAARAIAEEYFRAETVLARLLADLGIG